VSDSIHRAIGQGDAVNERSATKVMFHNMPERVLVLIDRSWWAVDHLQTALLRPIIWEVALAHDLAEKAWLLEAWRPLNFKKRSRWRYLNHSARQVVSFKSSI
jgi:hypothetical protein